MSSPDAGVLLSEPELMSGREPDDGYRPLRIGLRDLYERLLLSYGPQHWWPARSTFEIVVGAVLTQRTAWSNAERAIARLEEADALSPDALLELEPERLAELIRPAGFWKAKARSLKAVSALIVLQHGGSLDALLSLPLPELRAALLAIPGIGAETADAIALYAGGRPTFVVDAYTRRILSRIGLRPPADRYEDWRSFFMSSLPHDPGLFNEYHALLVRHGKQTCRQRPLCGSCALRRICAHGASVAGAVGGPEDRRSR